LEAGSMKPIRMAIVGVGKIARDQHIPALRADPGFELVACVSRHAVVEGVANFGTLEELLEGDVEVDAVAICTPPQVHYEGARLALERGMHLLLEKPPCATTAQLAELARLAETAGRTLFQTWHSQHAAGVETARRWLASRAVRGGRITWKEDVRRWHPGQTWIWRAGGFGVFDPGINAISILTRILPLPVFVTAAELSVPSNCDSPIAAEVAFVTDAGAAIAADFDFRQTGPQTWDIEIETDDGVLKLSNGGETLAIDGAPAAAEGPGEYPSLYSRFAELVRQGASEVDGKPFQLVADAFMIGRRTAVEPFLE
jgi:predicted dehydrogenase